jgi:hypothetical protein
MINKEWFGRRTCDFNSPVSLQTDVVDAAPSRPQHEATHHSCEISLLFHLFTFRLFLF